MMLEEPEIFGVNKFGDSAVIKQGRIRTKPGRQWETGREYLRQIKISFDGNSIEFLTLTTLVFMAPENKPTDILYKKNKRSENQSEFCRLI